MIVVRLARLVLGAGMSGFGSPGWCCLSVSGGEREKIIKAAIHTQLKFHLACPPLNG